MAKLAVLAFPEYIVTVLPVPAAMLVAVPLMTSPPVTLPLATAVLATALAVPADTVTLPPVLTKLPLSVRLPVLVDSATSPVVLAAPTFKAMLLDTFNALALLTVSWPVSKLLLFVSVTLPVPADKLVPPATVRFEPMPCVMLLFDAFTVSPPDATILASASAVLLATLKLPTEVALNPPAKLLPLLVRVTLEVPTLMSVTPVILSVEPAAWVTLPLPAPSPKASLPAPVTLPTLMLEALDDKVVVPPVMLIKPVISSPVVSDNTTKPFVLVVPVTLNVPLFERMYCTPPLALSVLVPFITMLCA